MSNGLVTWGESEYFNLDFPICAPVTEMHSDEEMKERESGCKDHFHEIFDQIDGQNTTSAKDGFIGSDEMNAFTDMLLNSSAIDQAEKDFILNKYGKLCGEDGQLECDEFTMLVEAIRARDSQGQQQNRGELFKVLDSDKDGQLSSEETVKALLGVVRQGHLDEESAWLLYQVAGF